jgi:predicted DNA binding CopG/RHH family protein
MVTRDKMNEHVDNKFNFEIEQKIDSLLEQQAATQRAIAHLKADLRTIIKETVTEVVNKHAVQGYSRISGGK